MLQQRKQLRLKGWDYGKGWYFVTVCIKSRKCIFGNIQKNDILLSQEGHIVEKWISSLPLHYDDVSIDCSVVMPNHVHMIVVLRPKLDVGTIHELSLRMQKTRTHIPLSNIIGYWKMHTAKEINALHNSQGTPFWQRSYYERIIRNEREYQELCAYIRNNPRNWYEDSLYAPK
jgi:REP element-mobilizing transposase RayT